MKIVELENGLVDIEKISRLWCESEYVDSEEYSRPISWHEGEFEPICICTTKKPPKHRDSYYMLVEGYRFYITKQDYDKIYGLLTKKMNYGKVYIDRR